MKLVSVTLILVVTPLMFMVSCGDEEDTQEPYKIAIGNDWTPYDAGVLTGLNHDILTAICAANTGMDCEIIDAPYNECFTADDDGNMVAASYGLRWTLPSNLQTLYMQFGIDLPAGNGDDSWTLPLPARYIIDRQGKLVYARTDPDYTRRPEPNETLDALARLG